MWSFICNLGSSKSARDAPSPETPAAAIPHTPQKRPSSAVTVESPLVAGTPGAHLPRELQSDFFEDYVRSRRDDYTDDDIDGDGSLFSSARDAEPADATGDIHRHESLFALARNAKPADATTTIVLDPPRRRTSPRERKFAFKTNGIVAVVAASSFDDAAVQDVLQKCFWRDGFPYTPSKPKLVSSDHEFGSKCAYLRCLCKGDKSGDGDTQAYNCPYVVRVYLGGSKATIVTGDYDHDHPPLKDLLDRARGLSWPVKDALEPLIHKDSWNMTMAVDLLVRKGYVLNMATNGDEIKNRISRYVQAARTSAGAGDPWKGKYGELCGAVEAKLVDDDQLARMVKEGLWDESIVVASDVCGEKKTSFWVLATIRTLVKAIQQRLAMPFSYAAGDGTGRLTYEGKLLVLVTTISPRMQGHLIAAFMLSKGEKGDEIARAFKAIRHAIAVVHKAMLDSSEPLYDVAKVGAEFTWKPEITMNDSSDAYFNAWEKLRL